MTPSNEVCQNLVDVITEQELNIEINSNPGSCELEGTVCHQYDGIWIHDGSVSYC